MNENKKIIMAYGFNVIYQPVTFNDSEIVFMTASEGSSFENFQILIYFKGFPFEYERSGLGHSCLLDAPNQAVRRIKEIRMALDQGKTICFIGYDACDYVVSGILHSLGIHEVWLEEGRKIYSNTVTKRSEFKPFLDSVGATKIYFGPDLIDDVICVTQYDNLLGFCKNVGKGKLFFIPCAFGSSQMSYIVDNLEKLIQGIDAFSAKKITQAPSYIDGFQFKEETVTINKIKEITENQLKPLEDKVATFNQLKRILWLGDNNLVNALCDFFKIINFETKIDEIFEEDFWLLKQGREKVIVEVKGLNKNLTREDIAKADLHREARKVPEMTGLLIANTFMTAQSMERKNEAFPPNVIEKAVNSNMVIMRTIDLCLLFDYLEQNNMTPKFIDLMIGKHGWLTLQNNCIVFKEK